MSIVVAEEVPTKLFYRINEVSSITGLKPYVLRYWESEFRQLNPEKDENDQRRYRQKDIDLVLEIKNLLYEQRYTIAGAREKLKNKNKATIVKITPRRSSNKRKVKQITRSLQSVRKDLTSILSALEV